VQFTLRGDGAHQYHFANDLVWNAGPGYYFIRRHDLIVALQFIASGEYKDVDRFRGKKAEDTVSLPCFSARAWWRRVARSLHAFLDRLNRVEMRIVTARYCRL
jgi:hypothetical protein